MSFGESENTGDSYGSSSFQFVACKMWCMSSCLIEYGPVLRITIQSQVYTMRDAVEASDAYVPPTDE